MINRLCIVAEQGNLKEVKRRVKRGDDLHAENDYALRWASRYGHIEVVKYLVEQGLDIYSENGMSLLWASEYGHLEVVKFLYEKGLKNSETIMRKALIMSDAYDRVEVSAFLKRKLLKEKLLTLTL